MGAVVVFFAADFPLASISLTFLMIRTTGSALNINPWSPVQTYHTLSQTEREWFSDSLFVRSAMVILVVRHIWETTVIFSSMLSIFVIHLKWNLLLDNFGLISYIWFHIIPQTSSELKYQEIPHKKSNVIFLKNFIFRFLSFDSISKLACFSNLYCVY